MKKLRHIAVFVFGLLLPIISYAQDLPNYRVRVYYDFQLPDAQSGLSSYGTIIIDQGGDDDLEYDSGRNFNIGLNKNGYFYASAGNLTGQLSDSEARGFAEINIAFITGATNYHRYYNFNQWEVYYAPFPYEYYRTRPHPIEETCYEYTYRGSLYDSDADSTTLPENSDEDYFDLSLTYVYVSTQEELEDRRPATASISINEVITQSSFRLASFNSLNMLEVSVDDNDSDLSNNEWHTIAFAGPNSKSSWRLSEFFTEDELINEQIQFRGVVCNSYSWDEDERVYTKDNPAAINFILESPNLAEDPEIQNVSCKDGDDGEVKLIFAREITDGLHLLVNLKETNGDIIDDYRIYSGDLDDDLSYIISNLPAKDYILVYASRDNEDNDVVDQSENPVQTDFTINEPSAVILNQNSIQPVCDDDTGSITVTALGGKDSGFGRENGRYTFYLTGDKIETYTGTTSTTSHTFNDLDPGTYNIAVSLDIVGLNECTTAYQQVIINEVTNGIAYSGAIQSDSQDINQASYPTATDGSITADFTGGAAPFTATIQKSTAATPTALAPITGAPFEAQFTGLDEGTYEIVITDDNGCSLKYSEIELTSKPLPVIDNITITDIECFNDTNGTLQANVSSGDGSGYLYQWTKQDDASFSNSFSSVSGLDKGIYELRVSNLSVNDFTNSSAYTSQSIEIGAGLTPVEITNVDLQNAQCFGDTGKITLTVEGGTGNYFYTFGAFGTFIPLPANGEIEVNSTTTQDIYVRDANDCQTSASDIEVLVPSEALTLNYVSQIDNTVNGEDEGSFELELYGGYGNYTYTWEKDGVSFVPDFTYNSGLETLQVTNLSAGSYTVSVEDNEGCRVNLSPLLVITQPEPLRISIINEDTAINCSGNTGVLSVTATGGSESYTYEWTYNGASLGNTNAILNNAEAGNYTVTANDGFTTVTTALFNLAEPDPVTFTATPIDARCHGESNGSITINALGGNDTYEYSIDNQVTYIALNTTTNRIENLASGIYTVWLRDTNLCEAVLSIEVTIGEPDEIIIEELVNTIIETRGANTGVLEVTVSGGIAPLSYSWSRALDPLFNATGLRIENLYADEYTLTVTYSNDCEVSSSFMVLQPEPLTVSIQETESILCYGQSTATLTATANGGFPIDASLEDYLFIWEEVLPTGLNEVARGIGLNILENRAIGEFQVTVQDINTTMVSDNHSIEQPEALQITLESLSDESCFEEGDGGIDISVTGGPVDEISGAYLPYTYSWTKVDDDLFSSTNPDLENLSQGTYQLIVTDSNNCTTLVQSFEIDLASPRIEISEPVVTGLSGFETNDGAIALTAIGGTGNLNYSWTSLEDSSYVATTLNISDLAEGNYTLEVTDELGCSQTLDVFVGQPEVLSVTIDEAQPNICYNGTTADLMAIVEGGFLESTSRDYQYQWYKLNSDNVFEPIILGTSFELRNQSYGTYKVEVTDDNDIQSEAEIYTDAPDNINIELIAIEHIGCYESETGNITVSVTGGPTDAFGNYLSYQFEWIKVGDPRFTAITQNLSNIASGSYVLNVTDANLCEVSSEPFIINPIDEPIEIQEIEKINASSEDAADGSIDVDVTGGTSPYTYSWTSIENPTFSANTQDIENLYRGLYTLIVRDANGCEEIYESRIAIPGELVIENVRVIDPICYNECTGSVEVDVEGGLTPYTFRWSNDATTQNVNELCPGIYTLEVTDRINTTTSIEVEIKNASVFDVILPEDITLCESQIGTIDGTQSDAVTYSWTSDFGFTSSDPIISVNETGLYELTITNADDCTASNTIYVEATNTVISADFISASQVFVNESFILVNIADPLPDRSQWIIPEEAIVGSNDETYLELQFDTPGTYEVGFAVDLGLCYEESIKQIVVIEPTEEDSNLVPVSTESFIKHKMYPNPIANGLLTIEVETSEEVPVHISIYSTSSRNILIQRTTNDALEHTETFDVSRFSAGLYFVVIETRLGDQVLKLIKG